jgi:hypothetical protein
MSTFIQFQILLIGNSIIIYTFIQALQLNHLEDLVALAVEGNVYWGNWEFVFVDGGNWELVDVDGGNGQVVTLGLETGIIGNPGQSEALAFGRNPVRRSLAGVAKDLLFVFLAVVIIFSDDKLLLDVRLITSGAIRSSIAYLYQIIQFTIMLGNLKIPLISKRHFYLHAPLPSRLRTSDWLTMVISGALYSLS